MEKNFINFSEKEKDEPIYRIVSIETLYKLIGYGQNFLSSPKIWDDPFEKSIAGLIEDWREPDEARVGFKSYFYGQCWSRTRESDAMWRIYSRNKNGARIKTTPRKLLNSIYSKTHTDIRDGCCYIGKVSYLNTPQLKEHLEKNLAMWILGYVNDRIPQSFLFKRPAFRHENEVRLIYNSFMDTHKYDLRNFYYLIRPMDLIEDIVFDPRIEYEEFKKHKKFLIEKGFKKRIVKSKLYSIPELNIKRL
ncbi:DUF2971 domain-containing protein [Mesonia sp. K4-1]|uniref:DUF2971 domain-containing protein n=1 Tax=Mesonia sp. K4-1 TaxID=2602760 RepID=UPI0011C935FD|nr:DUF2971 domain-containing protein [Mesonia sp. K4-1]TXK74165.1 DUF2971 domain-containing protein [Mesonia sp. K4-1]